MTARPFHVLASSPVRRGMWAPRALSPESPLVLLGFFDPTGLNNRFVDQRFSVDRTLLTQTNQRTRVRAAALDPSLCLAGTGRFRPHKR